MFRGMHRIVGALLLVVGALVASSPASALPPPAVVAHGGVAAGGFWAEVSAYLTRLWPGTSVGDHDGGGATTAVAAGDGGSGTDSGPGADPNG
jgi:hypothetical protein